MLIDGNSIINRAFYAIPVLTNKENEYTNAVYGFLNIFFKLYDEEKPDYVVVAFDMHAKTFRHHKYEEYKGGRKAMPEDLRPQIPLLKNLLKKMNIKTVELEGYEADDILGTLAKKSKKQQLLPVVVSGDKDLLQLASKNILIRIPKTKSGKTEIENYYENDVVEKIGVTPKEYICVKALMGDASDNIPGVPGIGEKTAVKIIQEYKTLENAIANAAEIKPKKASENLTQYAWQARLSRELAEIVTDAPIELTLPEMLADKMFNEESRAEIQRLEFKSMIQRFSEKEIVNLNASTSSNIITTILGVKEALSVVPTGSPVSFYTAVIFDTLLGVSIAYGENESAFLKIGTELSESCLYNELTAFLESDIPKILLDSKREIMIAKKHGIEIKNIIFDSMLAGYVINSSKNSYNYDDIAFDFLNESYMSLNEMIGKGRNKKTISGFSEDEKALYAIRNAEVIYRAYKPMKDLITENLQEYLYYEIELPLAGVLADMELTGVKVNKEELKVFGKMLDEHIDKLQADIYSLTGEVFNINSPSQLGVILFEKLNLTGSKKTKTGYSTSAEVLEKIKHKHPAISKILEYRTYSKLKSTYIDGLISVINPNDGKIYSSFNQAVTTTGRISSTEPNLQNIPVRLPLGRELRKAFIPTDDSFIFMDGDYSQIELRVMAHMAEDDVLINAFKNNLDIHALTASQVYNTPFEEVTSAQRNSAKAVNFGIIYGISGYSLSEDLGISKKEADRYINEYFEKYPQVKKYLDNSIDFARKKGYARTIFNRRRMIPEIMTQNFFERAFGERVAMNMPVQGSAADIIKIAMVKVHKRLKDENLKSRIILQVHDELLLEVKKDECDTVRAILKEEMENCAPLSTPLLVDIHEGENWYEAK